MTDPKTTTGTGNIAIGYSAMGENTDADCTIYRIVAGEVTNVRYYVSTATTAELSGRRSDHHLSCGR